MQKISATAGTVTVESTTRVSTGPTNLYPRLRSVSIQRSPPGSWPSTFRIAAIWTGRLASSTVNPVQAASSSASFETGAPACSTRTRNRATARLPTGSGSPFLNKISASASRRNGPRAYIAVLIRFLVRKRFGTSLEPFCDFAADSGQGAICYRRGPEMPKESSMFSI